MENNQESKESSSFQPPTRSSPPSRFVPPPPPTGLPPPSPMGSKGSVPGGRNDGPEALQLPSYVQPPSPPGMTTAAPGGENTSNFNSFPPSPIQSRLQSEEGQSLTQKLLSAESQRTMSGTGGMNQNTSTLVVQQQLTANSTSTLRRVSTGSSNNLHTVSSGAGTSPTSSWNPGSPPPLPPPMLPGLPTGFSGIVGLTDDITGDSRSNLSSPQVSYSGSPLQSPPTGPSGANIISFDEHVRKFMNDEDAGAGAPPFVNTTQRSNTNSTPDYTTATSAAGTVSGNEQFVSLQNRVNSYGSSSYQTTQQQHSWMKGSSGDVSMREPPGLGATGRQHSQQSTGGPNSSSSSLQQNTNNNLVRDVIDVEERHLGLIFGRNASTIRALREDTGASIFVEKDAIPLPRVIIRGTRMQTELAGRKIRQLLQQKRQRGGIAELKIQTARLRMALVNLLKNNNQNQATTGETAEQNGEKEMKDTTGQEMLAADILSDANFLEVWNSCGRLPLIKTVLNQDPFEIFHKGGQLGIRLSGPYYLEQEDDQLIRRYGQQEKELMNAPSENQTVTASELLDAPNSGGLEPNSGPSKTTASSSPTFVQRTESTGAPTASTLVQSESKHAQFGRQPTTDDLLGVWDSFSLENSPSSTNKCSNKEYPEVEAKKNRISGTISSLASSGGVLPISPILSATNTPTHGSSTNQKSGPNKSPMNGSHGINGGNNEHRTTSNGMNGANSHLSSTSSRNPEEPIPNLLQALMAADLEDSLDQSPSKSYPIDAQDQLVSKSPTPRDKLEKKEDDHSGSKKIKGVNILSLLQDPSQSDNVLPQNSDRSGNNNQESSTGSSTEQTNSDQPIVIREIGSKGPKDAEADLVQHHTFDPSRGASQFDSWELRDHAFFGSPEQVRGPLGEDDAWLSWFDPTWWNDKNAYNNSAGGGFGTDYNAAFGSTDSTTVPGSGAGTGNSGITQQPTSSGTTAANKEGPAGASPGGSSSTGAGLSPPAPPSLPAWLQQELDSQQYLQSGISIPSGTPPSDSKNTNALQSYDPATATFPRPPMPTRAVPEPPAPVGFAGPPGSSAAGLNPAQLALVQQQYEAIATMQQAQQLREAALYYNAYKTAFIQTAAQQFAAQQAAAAYGVAQLAQANANAQSTSAASGYNNQQSWYGQGNANSSAGVNQNQQQGGLQSQLQNSTMTGSETATSTGQYWQSGQEWVPPSGSVGAANPSSGPPGPHPPTGRMNNKKKDTKPNQYSQSLYEQQASYWNSFYGAAASSQNTTKAAAAHAQAEAISKAEQKATASKGSKEPYVPSKGAGSQFHNYTTTGFKQGHAGGGGGFSYSKGGTMYQNSGGQDVEHQEEQSNSTAAPSSPVPAGLKNTSSVSPTLSIEVPGTIGKAAVNNALTSQHAIAQANAAKGTANFHSWAMDQQKQPVRTGPLNASTLSAEEQKILNGEFTGLGTSPPPPPPVILASSSGTAKNASSASGPSVASGDKEKTTSGNNNLQPSPSLSKENSEVPSGTVEKERSGELNGWESLEEDSSALKAGPAVGNNNKEEQVSTNAGSPSPSPIVNEDTTPANASTTPSPNSQAGTAGDNSTTAPSSPEKMKPDTTSAPTIDFSQWILNNTMNDNQRQHLLRNQANAALVAAQTAAANASPNASKASTNPLETPEALEKMVQDLITPLTSPLNKNAPPGHLPVVGQAAAGQSPTGSANDEEKEKELEGTTTGSAAMKKGSSKDNSASKTTKDTTEKGPINSWLFTDRINQLPNTTNSYFSPGGLRTVPTYNSMKGRGGQAYPEESLTYQWEQHQQWQKHQQNQQQKQQSGQQGSSNSKGTTGGAGAAGTTTATTGAAASQGQGGSSAGNNNENSMNNSQNQNNNGSSTGGWGSWNGWSNNNGSSGWNSNNGNNMNANNNGSYGNIDMSPGSAYQWNQQYDHSYRGGAYGNKKGKYFFQSWQPKNATGKQHYNNQNNSIWGNSESIGVVSAADMQYNQQANAVAQQQNQQEQSALADYYANIAAEVNKGKDSGAGGGGNNPASSTDAIVTAAEPNSQTSAYYNSQQMAFSTNMKKKWNGVTNNGTTNGTSNNFSNANNNEVENNSNYDKSLYQTAHNNLAKAEGAELPGSGSSGADDYDRVADVLGAFDASTMPAGSGEFLSVKAGDVILVKKEEVSAGWSMVKLNTNEEGWIPTSFYRIRE
ncbi:unnamed protein product [Amoebophrya sp. A120]|nr:unnamed protein product [Amoebophrya sp. A120]|eukprot:GSA120T00015788001.1